MTNEQKYSGEFEKLSKKILQFLFRDTNAKINETRQNKDGGYDIIVSCRINRSLQKAFFECKLRNKNLTFRDIAANAIIAFNQGTVALVAITNHEFTQQTGEQLLKFYKKTVLNIKILTGSDLQLLIKEGHISVPEELQKLLHEQKNRRRNSFKELQLDFNRNVVEQLFSVYSNNSDSEKGNNKIENFFLKIYPKEVNKLSLGINAGRLVVVKGYWGVGKEELIQASAAYNRKNLIEIDAYMYETKDQLVLSILSKIWGIPEIELFSMFTKKQIQRITKEINGKANDAETIRILMALFKDYYGNKHATAVQNLLIVQYITELLVLHQNDIDYALFINNLQFAPREVCDFLVYLIKTLHENKIGCILRIQEQEYTITNSMSQLVPLKNFSCYSEIDLKPLSPEDAITYVKTLYPDISDHSAKVIVNQVGTRIKSLSSLLTYLFKECFILPSDDWLLTHSIQGLIENDVPSLISMLLREYRTLYPEVFEISHLLECRAPIEAFTMVGVSPQVLDRLIDAGVFQMEQNIILARNEFVRDWIQNMNGSSVTASECYYARTLLEKMKKQKNKYIIEKICLHHALGEYNTALDLLKINLRKLTRDKQYTTLNRGLSLAIKMSHYLNLIKEEADYLIQALELMTIQKQLTGDLALERIEQLDYCIRQKRDLPAHMTLALAFFRLKRSFKLGKYTKDYPEVKSGETYYKECISHIITNNEGDWLGRICSCYALTVKSTQGNKAALHIFETSLAALSNSFDLQREYLSHLACMELYKNAASAFEHYKAILKLFDDRAPDEAALPFHEYGDLAMSQLIAGNTEYASELVEKAINISQSNGLLDEEGRNINIRGCIELCDNKLEDAEASFREATAIMRHAECWNYAWRSELNYIQLCSRKGINNSKLLYMLNRLYEEFHDLLADKITILAESDSDTFYQTREYHALLVFGSCWSYLKSKEWALQAIPNDFNLCGYKKTYQQHLKCYLVGETDFMDTPYIKNGLIYLVG